ncbi:cytochrome d ubiquinol oxidase subunit II [Amycolatopsis australiensis]|uniref:Cytochrome bd-I ubiquinol oxidase subunit 2 apoprotein n=1 Tax=Amycolatopsis australiensis TaxID=546364 RepID=A0A1K1SRL3_9PSEU|nr:cytochrome d ubiquinol oxidase subunit II [Amycolatopsis australiensis]SFW86953.1 cytochrome bd-I ubiquinol oxidase subunit 2 apoprotein [Amycolatopsis australiensis]
MTLADWSVAVLWVGLTLYVLLAGADFGAGFWDLFAGGNHRGRGQRELIEHSIGPVWEANHVWLIFVLVTLWSAFPPVFAAVMSTLYIPLTLVALGIIIRGAAFAFRKASDTLGQQRLFGAAFAVSSVLTPFFLGTVAGGIASGRIPVAIAGGDLLTSWLNPTSVLGGVLAVGAAAYLAATYLCADARRSGDPGLAEAFRRRALATGLALGVIAAAGIPVLASDAPRLFDGLTHRGLLVVILSAVSGAVSLVLLLRRRFLAVRITAALAVGTLLWGWAVGQYPYLLEPDVTIAEGAATPAVLSATLAALGVGALVLIPSLWWLYSLFQRPARPPDRARTRT